MHISIIWDIIYLGQTMELFHMHISIIWDTNRKNDINNNK